VTTQAPPYDGIREGAAELALRRHGFTGERLLRLANRVASDVIAGRVKGIAPVPHIGDKRDDLVASMYERAIRKAMIYDPTMTNGGDHIQSFLAKHMEHEARDFFRRKRDGFGDARYNNQNRIVLSPMDDDPDPDVDFGALISEKRLARWQAAARLTDWTFEEFVVITLDRAAAQVERTAA
jgi:hypothetical protein